jgi:predicted nucleic acid-binding protein
MIVLDASALVELVLDTPAGRRVASRIADPALGLHIPHLADVEVTQALRRYTQKGEIDASESAQALTDLRALDLQRHAHEPLLDRVWELRENFSAYDATYIALAEVLDTILLTCDGPLARAPGMVARVELIAPPEEPSAPRPRKASRPRT